MSDKMECPGCETYGSDVISDYRNGQSCRHCSLAPSTADEIRVAQRRGADATLTAQLTDALKRAAAAESERDRLKGIPSRLIVAARGAAEEADDKRSWERGW